MSSSLLVALFAFLFVATLIACISLYVSFRNQLKSKDLEKESLKIAFDQIRKEKIDLQDRVSLAQNEEKTYKVAFEDWKSKYDLMESKYNSMKRELETRQPISEKSESNPIQYTNTSHESQSPTLTKELSQITADLKTILNQHLEVLGKFVSTESIQTQLTKQETPSDPLHWIMGIDEDTSRLLNNQGINTFKQLSELPKTELKKLMIQFDDIDDRVIESWPMQAGALIRSKENQ